MDLIKYAKQLLIIAICLFSVKSHSQDNYTILHKYKFHSMEFLDTGTEKLLEDFTDISGVIVDCIVNGDEYLLISIPGVHDYHIRIVHKATDVPPENDVKMDLYQGGEKVEGIGTYTCNVFFVYDITKNAQMPQWVRLAIDNSSNIVQFKGIIEL